MHFIVPINLPPVADAIGGLRLCHIITGALSAELLHERNRGTDARGVEMGIGRTPSLLVVLAVGVSASQRTLPLESSGPPTGWAVT